MSAQSTISRENIKMSSEGAGNYLEIKNTTAEKILVYGPPRATDGGNYDTSWYVLHPGAATPKSWECRGFFVPKDRSFSSESGSTAQGPVAIKYNTGKSITLTSTGSQYIAKGNTDDGTFHQSEINWPIPDFSCEDCQCMNKPRYEILTDQQLMKQNYEYGV